MKNLQVFIILLLILAWQCTPHYLHDGFDQMARDHEIIAVLPVEVVFTGQAPENLSEEDIIEIERAESLSFQLSLYNDILRSTKSGRKPLWVNLQTTKRTNSLLDDASIDIFASWDSDPVELAEILDVDAVLVSRIEKMRYMSDLESFGIDLGVHIANAILSHPFWWIPHNLAKSKEIRASYQLVDRGNGTTIWSFADNVPADWSQTSEEIIREVTRRASRKFPYRR